MPDTADVDRGFDVGEVVAEYGILREALVELIARKLAPSARSAEMPRLHAAIDLAVSESVQQCTAAREWTLRALNRISEAALEFSEEDKLLFRTMANRATAMIVQGQLLERERAARAEAQKLTEVLEAQEQRLRTSLALRDQVMGVLSHDLRNPLNVIRGCAQLFDKLDGLSDAQITTVKRVISNVDRIERMVRDLLDYTRARSGHFHRALGHVDGGPLPRRDRFDEAVASGPDVPAFRLGGYARGMGPRPRRARDLEPRQQRDQPRA